MSISDVFYTNIVKNEDKEDGAPFVVPKARVGGGLVLPHCV